MSALWPPIVTRIAWRRRGSNPSPVIVIFVPRMSPLVGKPRTRTTLASSSKGVPIRQQIALKAKQKGPVGVAT